MSEFSGVFPVYGINFEVNTAASGASEVYKEIADMESIALTIDTGIETWTPLDADGWQKALATAKSFKMSVSGKRNVGDEGNDFIASKNLANGHDCDVGIRLTFPDGNIFKGNTVISVTECGTGDSTNVGPLKFDLTSNGKPSFGKT